VKVATTWGRRAVVAVGSAAAMLTLGPVDVAGSSTMTGRQPADPPALTAELSPTTGAGGHEMTYSSVDPCPVVEGARLFYSIWPDGVLESGQEDALPIQEGDADVAEDGSWSTVVTAPEEAGAFEIVASCRTEDQQSHGEYTPIFFDVIPDLNEDPSTNLPTHPEAGSEAPPARPVPGEPNFTG
jgi:hypothetical protein